MPDLTLILAGKDAAAAADQLAAALQQGEPVAVTRRSAAESGLPAALRGAVDPIALAAVVITVPCAALAVWDIVARLRNRPKAHAVVETAQRLQVEMQVEISVLALDGTPRPLASLDADGLLDLVAELDPPPARRGDQQAQS
jgi:hypothetical protein